MKKILLLIVVIGLSVNCYSQLSLGVKGGVTFADLHIKDGDTEMRLRYKFGLSAQYMFSNIGIESGLYLKEIGTKRSHGVLLRKEGNGSEFVSMEDVKLRYLELPVSAVYKIPLKEHLLLSFNAGCYLAYGIESSGILAYPKGAFGMSPFEEFDIKNGQDLADHHAEAASRFDYGLIAGIGVECYDLSFNLNYELGLGNVYDTYPIYNSYKPISNDPVTYESVPYKNIKNRVLWLSVGYKFNL